jgi:hypothetical protein
MVCSVYVIVFMQYKLVFVLQEFTSLDYVGMLDFC